MSAQLNWRRTSRNYPPPRWGAAMVALSVAGWIIRNVTTRQVPLKARVAILACIDSRLLLPHTYHALRERHTFLIRMASGGAAVMTERDGASAIGQIVDAYAVHPIEKVVLRLHLGCGKLRFLTEPGGELHGEIDRDSAADLYRLGHQAATRVAAALREAHGVDVPVEVRVFRIIRRWHGFTGTRLVSKAA